MVDRIPNTRRHIEEQIADLPVHDSVVGTGLSRFKVVEAPSDWSSIPHDPEPPKVAEHEVFYASDVVIENAASLLTEKQRRALELTRKLKVRPGPDGAEDITLRPDHGTIADRRVDERASEDGLDKNRKPILPSDVHIEHSASGVVAPHEAQPEFKRTRRHPYIVSDQVPAPVAAFMAQGRQG